MATALMLVQPSGELWKKIRIELNEDVKRTNDDLAAIKSWLKQQPHLPNEWEDTCLLNFLRGCSFSMEKCKRKLDMYFTMRTACPEFFSNRDITRPELRDLCLKVQFVTFPGLTPQGRRFSSGTALDPALDSRFLSDIFKIVFMMGDVRLREELEGVSGDVYVLNAAFFTSRHLAHLSPTILKKFFICVQEAYPVKVKEVHVINTSPLIDLAYNIIKQFLSEKIRSRVFFHSDVSELQKYFPKEMLPVDYGGDAESLEKYHKAWIKKLESYTPWYKAQEHLKANEALRPGRPTNYDELFGVDGSFRKLSID